MSAMQRNKGRSGEQEVARLIRDWLGLDVHRNWQAQTAEGGADLSGVPGWAIEVKFCTSTDRAGGVRLANRPPRSTPSPR